MKTPVVIAAYNEANYIGATLSRLDAEQVEPYVMVNGSSDATAEIARKYTNNVVELPEAGKLPAMQEAFKLLGHEALNPVLLLDADAWPVFPRKWPRIMQKQLGDNGPSVVSGMTCFWDTNIMDRIIRSGRRAQLNFRTHREGSMETVYGSNLAIRLAKPALLDEFLELPHIWPGEDRYVAEMVNQQGTFTQLINAASLVSMSARYVPDLKERLSKGQKATGQLVRSNYANRRAPSVTHYARNGKLHAYESINTQESISQEP